MAKAFAASLILLLLPAAGCGNGADGPGDGTQEDPASDFPDIDGHTDPVDDDEEDGAEPDVADMPVETSDDSPAEGIELIVEGPDHWQRGPITLHYDIVCDGCADLTVTIDFSTEGSTFQPATPLEAYGDGLESLPAGTHVFVWGSFADIEADEESVLVRFVATGGDESSPPAVAEPMQVMNRPDRPRPVLMTSSINDNDKVRLLAWDHTDGLSFDDEIYTLDLSPKRAVFEPGGKAAVVFGPDDETLVFFDFSADGSVGERAVLATPGSSFNNAEFSGDTSVLYLLNYNPTDFGGGLYALQCDPWTGLPVEGETPVMLYPLFSAANFALVPENRGFVALGGSEGDERGALRLQSVSPDGELLDEVYFGSDGSLGEALAVSPDGQWVLAAFMNLFGEDGAVILFGLGEDGGILEAGDPDRVAMTWPGDIAFHAYSTAALVTQISPDRVISLAIGEGGTLVQVSSLPLGAAERIAHPIVGPDRHEYFVTTVHPSSSELGSGIGIFSLSSDGSATHRDTFYLGAGIDKIPSDVAIQP